MQTIVTNPRHRVQYESEWNYYTLCYKEGESSNNETLKSVALSRISKLLQEIFYTDTPATDYNFPDYAMYVHLLNSKGYKPATKHRPINS